MADDKKKWPEVLTKQEAQDAKDYLEESVRLGDTSEKAAKDVRAEIDKRTKQEKAND